MGTKKKFEIGQDVYIALLDRNKNELYCLTAKVMDITYGDEIIYVCKTYAGSKLYNIPEKDVFATYQETEEYCKKYTITKIKTKQSKNYQKIMNDLEKLKAAYEVIRDLETRDDLHGLKNSVTAVKNLLANELAFEYVFGKE